MPTLQAHIEAVQQRIIHACQPYGRDASDVTLLAVSKTVPVEVIQQAIQAGLRHFGENYITEAVEKIQYLQAQPLLLSHPSSHPSQPPPIWHCIGPVQSNKTRLVATHFDWVHTLASLKTAQRLNDQRPAHLPPLQVCIQVNIDGGATKSGVLPQETLALAQSIAQLPRLKLRGIMTIPDIVPTESTDIAINFEANKVIHMCTKALFDSLNQHGFQLDTLSMGMSADLEPAIAAGSTLVRVGTAIFGSRTQLN